MPPPVAEAAGAKTQMTGVVGALIVALLIVAAPMLFQDLPYAALAAVVIAAAIGLFEIADLGRIYRIQNWEFWLSIVCPVGVAVFGAVSGAIPGTSRRVSGTATWLLAMRSIDHRCLGNTAASGR